MYFELNRRFTEVLKELPDNVLSPNFEPINNDSEREKFIKKMLIYFNLCYEEYYLMRNTTSIEKKLYEEWERAIKHYMSLPAFRYAWEIIEKRNWYEKINKDNFHEYMERIYQNPGR